MKAAAFAQQAWLDRVKWKQPKDHAAACSAADARLPSQQVLQDTPAAPSPHRLNRHHQEPPQQNQHAHQTQSATDHQQKTALNQPVEVAHCHLQEHAGSVGLAAQLHSCPGSKVQPQTASLSIDEAADSAEQARP